jgi:hypothetical protein
MAGAGAGLRGCTGDQNCFMPNRDRAARLSFAAKDGIGTPAIFSGRIITPK